MDNRLLGDFSLKKKLGEGGGGSVYLAEQLSLRREAVVKVMLRRSGDVSAAERFLRETRLASQLDHPFAAHIYDFGCEPDGVMWLAMELVRGATLAQIIADQGPIPVARFVPFFERLCEVLQAAHDQGIVHRDIKPANVMVLNRAGRLLPKLLDLGIGRRHSDRSSDTGITQSGASEKSSPSGETAAGSETWADRIAGAETSALTQAGVVVGTPNYMAPEQWANASDADARADQYSLAVLAYQALVGVVPFKAPSLGALFRMHARSALPPLPESLAASLYPVLVKATAKEPSDRYSSVLELAAALRAASALGAEPFVLPQLSNDVRENVMSEAPQPIAESVAMLESARTPRQQLEAFSVVRRVIHRYVAIVALGARARVGSGSAADVSKIVDLCQRLSRGALADSEWLTLAQELCRPFSARRAAHPLPELVTFFFGSPSEEGAPEAIEALRSLGPLTEISKDAAESDLQAVLVRAMPVLNRVLQGLSFLFDYSLTVVRSAPERWMGSRRAHRLPQRGAHLEKVAAGSVVLVDAEGLPAVVLSPLVQVLSPGAGLPDEMFFLDGQGRHGARLIALPGPFERQDEGLWSWFDQNIDEFSSASGVVAAHEKAPFKGLSTFSVDDADNYFGREKESEAFANRLRISRLLAVVGPSGSGKSSFVLAGVLPLLPAGWRALVMRPGASPFESLHARVKTSVGAALSPGDRVTPAALLRCLAAGESVLLVVDQFEELVTLCTNPDTREAFAAFLVALADDPSGRFRVVLTLRDDFLIRVQQLGSLRERLSSSLQLLSTPAPDDLLRVVTEPTRRVGYGFDDPDLPKKMVREVAEYSGALALLSFTASQLWDLRDRHLRQLRAQTYEALGGVGGALAHHAEQTLAAMSEGEGQVVREAFRHLVTSSLTRAVMSRRDLVDVLGGEAVAAPVLDRLISSRLLVSAEEANGDDRIEIIHEALIVAWPRLVAWLREDAETARLRDSLRASAKQWGERGQPSGLLWRKETLAEYRVWRPRFRGRLTQLEASFAEASLREEARGLLIRRASVSVVLAGLVIGLIVLYRSNEASKANAVLASDNAAQSKERLQRLWQEQGRLAMVGGKPMEAMIYSRAARKLGAKSAAIDRVIAASASALTGSLGRIATLESRVLRLVASDDHRWLLASSPGETQLRSLEDPARHLEWKLRCLGLGFSTDSRRALVACDDNVARTVDLDTLSTTTKPLSVSFHQLHRSARGGFVGAERGAAVHEINVDGETRELYRVPGAPSLHAVPAPSGLVYVFPGYSDSTPQSPHTVEAVDARGQVVWRSPKSDDLVRFVSVDPNSQDVAIVRASGKVALYSAQHQVRWEQQIGLTTTEPIFAGDSIILPLANGLVASRNARTGAPNYLAAGAPAEIASIALGEGESLFVAAADGVLRKLSVRTGAALYAHSGHHGLVNAVVVVGERVISGGQDGALYAWDARQPSVRRVTELPISSAKATSDGFSAFVEGSALRIRGDGGVIELKRPLRGDAYALWEGVLDESGRVYSMHEQGIDVFDHGHAIWSLKGDLTFGAIDAQRGQVAYAVEGGDGYFVADIADGGVVTRVASLEGSTDMLLTRGLLLGNSPLEILIIDLRDPMTVKAVKAHGGVSSFARTANPDWFLTFGADRRLLGWNVADLSKPAFRIEELPSTVMAASMSQDASTVWALFSDGKLATFDTAQGLMLALTPWAQKTETAAINPRIGQVAFQDASGRMVIANLARVPAFESDEDLDAFIRERIPITLDGEKLVYH